MRAMTCEMFVGQASSRRWTSLTAPQKVAHARHFLSRGQT
ncbi:Uncharacterised protein [Mycobacteroides abscessus]|nr:Uncharacterised protein [Mycobacteroides abscessus]